MPDKTTLISQLQSSPQQASNESRRQKEKRRYAPQNQELMTRVIVPPEFDLARPFGARDEAAWPEEELGRLLLRGRPAERRALDETWCSPCEV
jgi:hypothetical protein